MIYYLNHKYQMKDTNNNRILELFENCDFENIKIPENIETKLLESNFTCTKFNIFIGK